MLLLEDELLDVLELDVDELDVLELVDGELDVLLVDEELDVLLVEDELELVDDVLELVELVLVLELVLDVDELVLEVEVLDDVVVVVLPIIRRCPLPINVKAAGHTPSTGAPNEMFVMMIVPVYVTPGCAWKVATAGGLPG